MKKFFGSTDQPVLPRPVEALPAYAKADARNALAERLVALFKFSELAAKTVADAVVDPTAVRKSFGSDDDAPSVEEIAVPGGKLLGIRTHVWARRIMPDPRNPRTGPVRRHAFAVDPGKGAEDSRFRPLSEPRSPDDKPHTTPELVVDVENSDHLAWASGQAAEFVLGANDWRESIKSQGVMEAVWLAATTYHHEDSAAGVCGLVTVEGSSRTTAVHNILQVRSSDVPYDSADAKLRAHLKKLTDAFQKDAKGETPLQPEEVVALRCERMPALILVGFKPNKADIAGFPTAVKSMVALRHVDPPTPWGEGPANEALADEVLNELHRRKLITSAERRYYAGAITKAEAKAAHLPDDAVLRAAKIVALFANAEGETFEAIRAAITSQSSRKRISRKICNALATALIVRSATGDIKQVDRYRRYMENAYHKSAYDDNTEWRATNRDVDALLPEALQEIREHLGSPTTADPGPASLELAVRAAYPMVLSGSLTADRGTQNNDQPDRREVNEVLDTMRRSPHGLHQLAQSVRCFSAGRRVRKVDENGEIVRQPDGVAEETVTDAQLRLAFPPPGKFKATAGGITPGELLRERKAALSDALDGLDAAFQALSEVLGNDGNPLIETAGMEPEFAGPRRDKLREITDELGIWERVFRKKYGIKTEKPRDDEGVRDDEGDE